MEFEGMFQAVYIEKQATQWPAIEWCRSFTQMPTIEWTIGNLIPLLT